MPDRYSLRRGLVFHIRSWNDEHVLLDETSGDTHLVGPQLLHALLQLNAAQDVALDDSTTRAAEGAGVLQSLIKLGLIEPLDP